MAIVDEALNTNVMDLSPHALQCRGISITSELLEIVIEALNGSDCTRPVVCWYRLRLGEARKELECTGRAVAKAFGKGQRHFGRGCVRRICQVALFYYHWYNQGPAGDNLKSGSVR